VPDGDGAAHGIDRDVSLRQTDLGPSRALSSIRNIETVPTPRPIVRRFVAQTVPSAPKSSLTPKAAFHD